MTTFKLQLITMLLSISVVFTHGHTHTHSKKCGFKHNMVPKLGIGKPLSKNILEDPKRKLYSGAHPIKIHVDTSNVNVSDDLKSYLVDLVVKEGNRIFAEKIGVTGPQVIEGHRNIPNHCSYENIVRVPDSYAESSIDADFILFLSAHDTGNDGTLAYASACYLEAGTGRPNIGFAVFNPYYLNAADKKLDNDVATYVHEVLHALVFSSQLWKQFPKVNGKSQYYVSGGNHYLRGPNLLQTARDHFGCEKLQGIPLEDDGGEGSKGGHFERIVFGDETMVAEDVAIAKFSKMTLALLKDSGWYNIDLSNGDYYTWGKGEGCELFYKTCKQSSVQETCDANNNFGCDKTFKYKMACKETTFTGGCNIKTKGMSCLKPHENMMYFESAASNSKCQEFVYKNKKMAACLQIQCNNAKNSYKVALKGDTPVIFTCKSENQVFKWGNNFKFICENPKVICNNLCPKACNHRGKCLENGKCSCDPFYSGEICGDFKGCMGLNKNICKKVVQANHLGTNNLSNQYSANDFDRNYLNYSSWNDDKPMTDNGINNNNNSNNNRPSNNNNSNNYNNGNSGGSTSGYGNQSGTRSGRWSSQGISGMIAIVMYSL